MHILFLTHYFPPEVNAPATRTYENARRWVEKGHKVTIITCAPNHPYGILYPGYHNQWFQWETMDGIQVLRVKTFLSANKGVKKRILNYISYMITAVIFCRLPKHPDVLVSTSPQFFCGAAGYIVSSIRRIPWVLEIRDLWPESIVAVGALQNKWIIKLLEGIETFLYRKADHVVALTQAFKNHIQQRKVPENRISVITNGADLDHFSPIPKENHWRKANGLKGKFIASYVGTHGMAHGLDTVLKAADRLRLREDIVFVLVGSGAERDHLIEKRKEMGLNNVLMLPQQPKDKIPDILGASNACMVLLKDTPLFRTVIPSKIFEAMAMKRPVILGVKGESQTIIEEANCGLCIKPENDQALSEAVLELAGNTEQCEKLGNNGYAFVRSRYNRDALAVNFLNTLQRLTGKIGSEQ